MIRQWASKRQKGPRTQTHTASDQDHVGLTAGLTLRTNRRTITTTRLVAISLGRPMNYPGRLRPTH